MAIMHPKNVFRFNSISEEKMYKALKEQLPDSYDVFYSVVWYTKGNQNNRINSESDFIVVDQNKGFLCIEVKGGTKYVHENDEYVVYNNNGDNIVKKISAYQQAENSMRYFMKNYEKIYNAEYKGIYGFMAAFPNYEMKDNVEEYFFQVKENTIDINDMNNLEQCIKKAFLYWGRKNSTATELFVSESKKKLCEMFKRTYAIEASKGALIEYKKQELEKINSVQENIINLLSNYNVFAMKGAAGTGKSWIAYKMACKNAILDRRKTLLVSKSKLLAEYFKNVNDISRYANLDILSFDELKDKNNIRDIDNVIIESEDKYAVILVDEAQDFTPEEAFYLRELLYDAIESKFYIFYDEEQNLYGNNLDETINKFMIDTKPYILTENLRNTKNIYDWARQRTTLGETSFSNQIDGPEPIMASFGTLNQINKYINKTIVNLIEKDKIPLEFINIVIDDDIYEDMKQYTYEFNVDYNNICNKGEKISIFNTSVFKGMESNIIFYVHKNNTEYNYKYVGLTRARFFLYDIEYNII